MDNPPPVLDYLGPLNQAPPRPFPRRPWICFLSLAVLYMGNTRARMTPPGWPSPEDFLLMLFLPAAALVMALLTSLPGWAIGFYGAIGACTFPLAQFSDTRFPLKIDSRNP